MVESTRRRRRHLLIISCAFAAAAGGCKTIEPERYVVYEEAKRAQGAPAPATNAPGQDNVTIAPAAGAAATPPSPAAAAGPAQGFVVAAPQPAAYALIVGIDRYRDLPAAPGARADAEIFAQVVTKTLGLRSEHVRLATDDHATRSDLLSGLKWLKESVTPGGRAYFFFSGHGAPTPESSTYLLPYDGSARDVAGSAVAMSEVMKLLGETKAKEVLAIVDSCFSGAGGRSVLPPGARALMRVKEVPPATNIALFSASASDEISGPAPGENVGLFSKYVTQAIGTGQADANGDGQISLKELSDWVTPRVAREAKNEKREQHPQLSIGTGVGGADNFIVEYGLASK